MQPIVTAVSGRINQYFLAKRINTYAMVLFFSVTLIVPAAPINKIIFMVLFLINIPVFICSRRVFLAPLIIFLIFLAGFCLSLMGDVDFGIATQQLLSILILFLIYPIKRYQIDMDFVAKTAGVALSFFTLLFYGLIVSNMASPFILNLFTMYGLGAYGLKGYTDTKYIMFQLASTPFLYIPFLIYIKKFKFRLFLIMQLCVTALVIVLSFSRGIVAVCMVGFVLTIGYKLRTKWRLVFIILALLGMISLVGYLSRNTVVLSPQEGSNSVKIGHATSFFQNVTPMQVLFGEGLGAYYFSEGRGKYVAQTEITPLDLIRYLGFIPMLIVNLLLIFPQRKLRLAQKERGYYLYVFALYLLLSLTNPVLFNSAGLLVVLWYWSKVISNSSDHNKKGLVQRLA